MLPDRSSYSVGDYSVKVDQLDVSIEAMHYYIRKHLKTRLFGTAVNYTHSISNNSDETYFVNTNKNQVYQPDKESIVDDAGSNVASGLFDHHIEVDADQTSVTSTTMTTSNEDDDDVDEMQRESTPFLTAHTATSMDTQQDSQNMTTTIAVEYDFVKDFVMSMPPFLAAIGQGFLTFSS